MCDMTHSHMWHDSFIYVTWLTHMCDMTHSYVWHDWFIYVTWLIHMCDMTHSYMWHDSFIYVTWLMHIHGMTQGRNALFLTSIQMHTYGYKDTQQWDRAYVCMRYACIQYLCIQNICMQYVCMQYVCMCRWIIGWMHVYSVDACTHSIHRSMTVHIHGKKSSEGTAKARYAVFL